MPRVVLCRVGGVLGLGIPGWISAELCYGLWCGVCGKVVGGCCVVSRRG